MPFRKLLRETPELLVDKVYEGGRQGNAGDDPLSALIGVGNQGGFRVIGKTDNPKLIVLSSNLSDPDWPDDIDKENGIVTYYGDNKKPGHDLHDTPKNGNLLLRSIFEKAHGTAEDRTQIPPIFIFANTGTYRDVQFVGLAVPGAQDLRDTHDLVALWKVKDGKRFQNYQAIFTILDISSVSRKWINDVKSGNPLSENCPPVWRNWVNTRTYRPLKAERTLEFRTKEEQLPSDEKDIKVLKTIKSYFECDATKFEICAGEIAKLMLKNISSIDITRPSRDGGRDAIGKFRIGNGESSVLVDFALEAKCYSTDNPVAVKELSRLISRLRHRQFGILVTTSYVARQAYQEIKEDGHPIMIISAVDIIRILKENGLSSPENLKNWLKTFQN
ncbi:restriction endonuclease [Chitinophaga sp. NPDC101104]|uniref:restriction endonuclease n=1 Tax=Chitinophaga sp. NPDC101104 TaxID=3390561 RepID=UPI003D0167E9